MTVTFKPDPKLDLVLERTVDVPPELLWAAWTRPEYLKQWFCPLPWKTIACELDVRPGGRFYALMGGPEGGQGGVDGCYLEVVENRRLTWTNVLTRDYRPAGQGFGLPFPVTAVIEMYPHGKGARYVATAIHRNPEEKGRHEQIGFHEGGADLDRLVALARTLKN